MMLVANNSFDLWQKDAFFSAAEEVQQSADILESMYRMWVRRREGQQVDYSDDLRRELQIALGTAKWQLDEFERAVRLSDGYRSQDNATSRHKQFIDVMEDQISRVEKALRESLAEEKQPLRWVSLDIEESDDFAAFLSGTSETLQTTTDRSLDIGLSKKSFFPKDQITRKDVYPDYTNGVTPDCITNYKEIVTIKKDSTYVVELEAKDISRTFDDTELAGQGKTWSSPNYGPWKIVIADEDEHANTLEMCDESSTKGKGFTSNLWRLKGGEHFQAKGGKLSYLLATGINRFSKFLKRLSGVQKQLQGQQYNQITRFIQIILLLILAIFLVEIERMTNTIHFYVDNASFSTSSPGSVLSQQKDQEGSEATDVEESSSFQSTTTVAAATKAINAWIRPPTCVNPDVMGSSFSLKSFRFSTLKEATRNFCPSATLEGSCGMVFKGWIDEQTLTATKLGMCIPIAVKLLKREGLQGRKAWLKNVHHIGNLSHPNLVRLLGYCLHEKLRLLVYEYMSRGSLEDHLFSMGYYYKLSWGIRMKIALGAAKALDFLHSADISGIHWGCKRSKILLDSNYNAKLSDFGLARDGRTVNRSRAYARVLWTCGYSCPGDVAAGCLTAKSDVYNFGVVLLEILFGQRAIDVNRWTKPCLNDKRKVSHVVGSLDGQCSVESAQKAFHLAFQCLANDAKLRPNMDVVVTALEELQVSETFESKETRMVNTSQT